MPASGYYAKEAEKLAREVRAEGYEAEVSKGHVFLVRRKGETKVRCRFAAHPKNESVLKQARGELRRRGILPGVGNLKKNVNGKKELDMAMVSEQQRLDAADLVPRIRGLLNGRGGDSPENRKWLIGRAVEIIQFRRAQGLNDVEQFGSTGQGKSSPVDIARESLRGLLDARRAGTDKSNARWSTVLDVLEVETQPQNGSGDLSAEAVEEAGEQVQTPDDERSETEPSDLDEPETALGDLDEAEYAELRERAELAESVVFDVEKERDDAKAEIARLEDAAENLRRALDAKTEQMHQEAEKANSKLKALRAELRKARSSSEIRSLKAKIAGLQGGIAKTKKAAETKGARQESHVTSLQEQRDALQERLQHAEARTANQEQQIERLKETVDQQAQTLDGLSADYDALSAVAGESGAGQARLLYLAALIDHLDRANGAPHDWVLSRLDALAGLDTFVGG